jgi:hypothetical protein
VTTSVPSAPSEYEACSASTPSPNVTRRVTACGQPVSSQMWRDSAMAAEQDGRTRRSDELDPMTRALLWRDLWHYLADECMRRARARRRAIRERGQEDMV